MSEKTKTSDMLNELNTMYRESDACDKAIFAEQRSNLLLIAGDHYNKRQASLFRRIRDNRELTDEQRLRLTKNHTQKITKMYVNNIIAMAPGVGFDPKNECEAQDQKAAELHHAVWRDACDRYAIESDLIDDWCDDFVGVGEAIVKIQWDPGLGEVKGYHQALDEEGMPVFDEYGRPAPDMENPQFSGAFIFEQIQGFNILRAPDAKNMKETPYLGYRKMSDVEALKKQFPDFESKINASMDETMVVFDSTKNSYQRASKQVMVVEWYFRPCHKYPRGYYYITVKEAILDEGELPGGIFPIIYQAFDKIPTTPRGRSPVKIMRPYQAEINRAASKIAEHQITLGDDKLLIQNNTKISAGVALPGVRSINYTGIDPKVLPGRDGSQYLAYMQAQIQEMYMVLSVAEDTMEQQSQLDPYTLLFRSASQKKKFQRYIRRFENFLVNVAKTYLSLAKVHLPEDQVILAIGKTEQVNISEFKGASDINVNITVAAQSEDVETKLGQQLSINHILQYTGNKLETDDIGKLIQQMPYANLDGSMDDFTLDYDSAQNIILALERGEQPVLQAEDNFVYLAKRLSARKRMADFRFLPQPVQINFGTAIQLCNQMEAQRQIKLQRLSSGYIPTDGYMVVCDLYQPDPADPAKTKRVRLPYNSLQWLIQNLEAQGQGLAELQQMGDSNAAAVSDMMGNQNPGPGGQGMPPGMGM